MAPTLLTTRAILLRGPDYRLPPLPSLKNPTRRPRLRHPLCSAAPPPPRSRRSTSLALLLLLSGCSARPRCADAGSPLDKYVKRKKLEPLVTYVPPVLLSEAQFKDLEKYLDAEQPKFDVSRSLLRSGPAASLRVNIRAVAQYATDDGKGKVASDAVDQCLRALEELDSLLLRASRKDQTASIESMKDKIITALVALDSLLQTVPLAVLDQGKAIADAYLAPSYGNGETKPGELDPDLKQLESLL